MLEAEKERPGIEGPIDPFICPSHHHKNKKFRLPSCSLHRNKMD